MTTETDSGARQTSAGAAALAGARVQPRPLRAAALAALLLGSSLGCTLPGGPAALPAPDEAAAPAETTVTEAPAATATAAPPLRLALDPGLPPEIEAAARALVLGAPERFALAGAGEEAELRLALGEGRPVARWVYALAAPFPTVEDGLTRAELETAWRGAEGGAARATLISTPTLPAATALLGPPGAGLSGARMVAEEALVDEAWAGPALTILPFDALEPRLKVLQVDGVSPYHEDFDPAAWPLALTIGAVGAPEAAAALDAAWSGPRTNRDPERLSVVAMTGVTALVRATAVAMEQRGVLWPGEEVRAVLRAADLAHVSNEVAFAEDCPDPQPQSGTTFCSKDAYFALLEDVGVDIVELTGNHVNDWGAANLARSLDMYEAAGMSWFGGGRDAADAAAPLLLEHNGNRLAFLGCNPVGPAFSWASADAAGSRECDGRLGEEIRALADEGRVVVVTQQYLEGYEYAATPQQKADFRSLAEAGAAVVSGSQAHHAMGFDFHAGAFIHQGLGNLFFDQMFSLGTRQSFVDRLIVYDGRLLGVDLWTGLIEDYARPREMSAAERAELLSAVFAASGW